MEFHFGARKLIYLNMHSLAFLSEDPWEIVIFVFIHFISCLFIYFHVSGFFISYSILIQPSRTVVLKIT